MAYFRRKRIHGRVYVYEARKVKIGQRWVEELIRYVGPEDPVYGGKGPVEIGAEARSPSVAPTFGRQTEGETDVRGHGA